MHCEIGVDIDRTTMTRIQIVRPVYVGAADIPPPPPRGRGQTKSASLPPWIFTRADACPRLFRGAQYVCQYGDSSVNIDDARGWYPLSSILSLYLSIDLPLLLSLPLCISLSLSLSLSLSFSLSLSLSCSFSLPSIRWLVLFVTVVVDALAI